MRMRPCSARHLNVDRPLPAKSVQLVCRNPLQLVLAHPRMQRTRHLVEGSVHCRRCVHHHKDFIVRLDFPRLQHHFLSVAQRIPPRLQLCQQLSVYNIHADRLLWIDPVLLHHHPQVCLKVIKMRFPCCWQRPEHRCMRRICAVCDPRAVQLFRRRFGAETKDIWLAVSRHDCISAHVIHLRRCDRRRCGIPLVLGCKQQQAAEIRFCHCFLNPLHPLLSHPVKVDSLLVIHLHRSFCSVQHLFFSFALSFQNPFNLIWYTFSSKQKSIKKTP